MDRQDDPADVGGGGPSPTSTSVSTRLTSPGGPSGVDRTGQPGVESALGRDRTHDGDLPPELGTNRPAGAAPAGGSALWPDRPRATGGPELGSSARQVVGQAQDAVGQMVGQVQEQATARLSGQFGRAAEGLSSLSQAMRSTGGQLREQDQATGAAYAEWVAEQTERAAGYLHGKDLDRVVEDVEGFARRQPALFVGGAFALGLAAARFLKSSGRGGSGRTGRGAATHETASPNLIRSPYGAPSYAPGAAAVLGEQSWPDAADRTARVSSPSSASTATWAPASASSASAGSPGTETPAPGPEV